VPCSQLTTGATKDYGDDGLRIDGF
jgi:hypothetical protein